MELYPPRVRTTAYGFGYNLSAGVVGGLTPIIITAISQQGGNGAGDGAVYAAGWWLLALCVPGAAAMAVIICRWERQQRKAALPLGV